jgi:hypothetical protein
MRMYEWPVPSFTSVTLGGAGGHRHTPTGRAGAESTLGTGARSLIISTRLAVDLARELTGRGNCGSDCEARSSWLFYPSV